MSIHHAIQLTANFEKNLDDIERFLIDADASRGFDDILSELTDIVLPNLQRYPAMGRRFLERPANSVEAANGAEEVAAQLKQLDPDGDLREYVMANYLLLYARLKGRVVLLSIRHHRQLSFDFQAHWPEDS